MYHPSPYRHAIVGFFRRAIAYRQPVAELFHFVTVADSLHGCKAREPLAAEEREGKRTGEPQESPISSRRKFSRALYAVPFAKQVSEVRHSHRIVIYETVICDKQKTLSLQNGALHSRRQESTAYLARARRPNTKPEEPSSSSSSTCVFLPEV